MRVTRLLSLIERIKTEDITGAEQFKRLSCSLGGIKHYPTAKQITPQQLQIAQYIIICIQQKLYLKAFAELERFMSYSNPRGEVTNAEYVIMRMLIQMCEAE